MDRQTISLGRIYGIPIRLHYSWFLVFALLTWSLAASYFPSELFGQPGALYWAMGAFTAIMLFASVLLHELGHSVVALRYEVPVRRITLFIFGGVAEIGSEPPSASSEFFIAIAGPIVSLALAVLFTLFQIVFSAWAPFFVTAKYLALINGSLALFNLIPGFPLDGGRVLRAILWGVTQNMHRATYLAASLGRGIGFLFIGLGFLRAFLGDFGGLWFAFIGWYLQRAAESQLQRESVASLLAGHPVSEAMNLNYILVPADAPLQVVVNQNLLGYRQRAFIVQEGDAVVGVLTWKDINAVPRERRNTTTASEAMIPVAHLRSIEPHTEMQTAAEELARNGASSLPVMRNGRILGTIGREELAWFLRRLQAQRA